jgi:hypothetical protein
MCLICRSTYFDFIAEEKEDPPSPGSPTEQGDEKTGNTNSNVKQEKQEVS